MKKILIFRHESWIETPHLTSLLTEIGIPFSFIKIDQGDLVAKNIADDIAGLVFAGGTMSVNDPLDWIEEELNLIRQAHLLKIPILGHCLGSQLISKALGGKVTPMKNKEIGWHPIDFLDNQDALEWKGKIPNHTKIILWHHDEFTIPEGASPLYTTEFCKNQAFVKDNILATVAHVEVSSQMLDEWLKIYGYDVEPNRGSVQTVEQIKNNIEDKVQEMHVLSDIFYLKWLKMAYPRNTDLSTYNKLKSYLKSGSCLCGDIAFFLKRSRDVVNCHCEKCRKFHGNHAAFTKVKLSDIYISGEQQLRWYQTKENQSRRGFCNTCGSSLFFKPADGDGICVAASALDLPTELKTIKNVYTDFASDFYNLDDSLEAHSTKMYDKTQ